MTTCIPPDLDSRFHPPKNWQWATVHYKRSRALRYGFVYAEQAKGALVILTGLNDIAEKYFETVNWAVSQGYHVFILDWFGQGGSGRYLDNVNKRHSDSFEEDINECEQWIESVVKPLAGDVPLFLLGHSMGGNYAMRVLMQNDHDFRGAIFIAPMFGIKALRWVPKLILKAAYRFCPQAYVVGGKDWSEIQHLPLPLSILTKDETRIHVEKEWMKANENLRIGGITYAWLYQAWQSCLKVQAFDSNDVKIPCLCVTVGHEHLVDNRATQRVINKINHVRHIHLDDAYHEPLLERDSIRDSLLQAINNFMSEQI